jgi:hypothetical protein
MEGSDSLERFVRAGLERLGLELDAAELVVIQAVDSIYGTQNDALMHVELGDVEPELAPDLSRPPESA